MKKKYVSVLVALSMILGMMTVGCGSDSGNGGSSDGGSSNSGSSNGGSESSEAGSQEEVKLTLYCNAVVKNDTPDIIAKFNEEYPNIEVEYVEMPADATKKNQTFSTILQAQDDSMDVFMIDTTWPESYTSSGWLEPLDDVLSEEEKEAYLPGPLEACTINGSLMALPAYIDAGVLLYRKDLLEKYGYDVPETWDEMTEIAKDISSKEEGMAGFVVSWKQYENLTCSVLEFVKSYGGDIVDADGNVKIGSKESGEGIQKMYDMIYTDKITDTGVNGYAVPDAAAIFNSGNAVFFRAWPAQYAEANNEEVSSVVGNVGVTSLPAGTAGSYSCLGGWHVGVSAYSSHKEEAKIFAKFFAGEVGNKVRALAGGNLPAIQSVYDDPEVQEAMPQFEYLRPCAENAAPRPKSIYYEEVSSATQLGVGSVLTEMSSIEDAQAQMQKQIEEIMSR